MELETAIGDFIQHCRCERALSEKTLKAYGTDLSQFRDFTRGDCNVRLIEEITRDGCKRTSSVHLSSDAASNPPRRPVPRFSRRPIVDAALHVRAGGKGLPRRNGTDLRADGGEGTRLGSRMLLIGNMSVCQGCLHIRCSLSGLIGIAIGACL